MAAFGAAAIVVLAALSMATLQGGRDLKVFEKSRAGLIGEAIERGEYACCLQTPCTYCLVKEGKCDCLEEVVNGEHPCGECMGEILEGHGNPYLAKSFARAIAHEVGEEHTDELREIIEQKYGVPAAEQS